ncbi:MAG: hypothetical protein KIS61_27605, partial [Candidatus Eremiobacteraeota bacterium]|nr:hypothetical protein [Candidatus Eremiobacteraeota bacterium]
LGIVGGGDHVGAFRIRFNYQNGSSTMPGSGMVFNHAYVSENNLNSASQKRVYRADKSGWSVDPASSFSPYDCPRYSAMILCEGLAGDGLRDLNPSNLGPAGVKRNVKRRVAEAVIGRNLSQLGDSPIYGAKDIQMNVKNSGQVKVRSSDAGVPPRARTLCDIYIQDASSGTHPVVDMSSKGEAYVNQSNGVMKVDGVDSTAPAATQEDSSGRFPRIKWSQITKAPPTAANIDAGTYVWRRSPRRLEYYAQPYDPAVGPPAATVTPDAVYNPSNPLAPTAISMDVNRLSLSITRDVYVKPNGGATGIAIVPEDGLIAAIQNRPNVEMAPATSTSNPPIITSQGDVFVKGSLRGQGSVTTEGNITFQGTSVLEADQDSRTAIYAKGDVTLEEIPPEITIGGTTTTGSGGGGGSGGGTPAVPFLSTLPAPPFGPPSYRDIAFSGLFYTHGSVKADFPAGTTDLYFRGMVVAFGADPDSPAAPGDNGRGRIDFTGGNVYLEYDSRYVVGPLNLTGPALLEVESYNLF